MDIEVLADKYEELENLINELVFLTQKRDELWEYHPNNPEGKNLIKVVKELSERIDQINDQLIKNHTVL